MDMYVYYRVPVGQAALLYERAAVMQAALAREFGVGAGLKRRPEEEHGRYTFMEVYPAVADDFGGALNDAVARAGLMNLIDGERHVEYFVDASSCV
ncbi:MAG: hypothetical protein JWQ23_1152 [Herminiimonas sp.]|jgi:hypothetical protein|nr:hypothetical protein [Herminiimonas sp.]